MFHKRRGFAVAVVALFALFISLPADSGQLVEKPPEVISTDDLPRESAQAESLRKELEAEIDAYKERMFEMNDWLYNNPEVGYEEVEDDEDARR